MQSAMLAERQGESPALIIASLLHDVGHFIDSDEHFPDEDFKHEALGASWLKPYFDQDVTQAIALHVEAKRYLSSVDPEYIATLSDASLHSLALQGGAMDSHAVERFTQRPFYNDALKLRAFDDEAKSVDCETPSLNYFLTTYVVPYLESKD